MYYLRVDNSWLSRLWHKLGYRDFYTLPRGISYEGKPHSTRDVKFLADLTWIDGNGDMCMDHEIFDEMLAMIRRASRLIIVDVFLFNDLLMRGDEPVRPLSAELTNALIAQKEAHPEMDIYFISDPCNTVYGGLPSLYFDELRAAGINLILTDLDSLRDSNPTYTFLWRLLVRPWGNSPGGLLPNPFGGGGRLSLRSYLQIFNIKANHRKTLMADDGSAWSAIVSTANPHDASHTNRNVGVKFSGPAVGDLFMSERAILEMNNVSPLPVLPEIPAEESDITVRVVTERKIKDAVLDTIDRAQAGDVLDMILFYLAEREIVNAIYMAHERGVAIRIVLDPNKDAFGWTKSGIPNRPVAFRLHKRGIPVRWADTRGEQCHSKMLQARYKNQTSTLILGSANFTRRNMDDFNLEADAVIAGPSTAPALAASHDMFEMVWHNRDNRQFTVDYEVYREKSIIQLWIYWLMERTGISTF